MPDWRTPLALRLAPLALPAAREREIIDELAQHLDDLSNDLREVLRVLKPGGRLVIIAETYKDRRMNWLFRPVMRLLLRATYLSLDEHRAALTNAGFVNVEIDADPPRGWMCAIGARPAESMTLPALTTDQKAKRT